MNVFAIGIHVNWVAPTKKRQSILWATKIRITFRMRNHSNHHTKWKDKLLSEQTIVCSFREWKKQCTKQTKQNHKNYETNFRCRLNVYQQQQYCTQFAHEHVRNITEDQSLVSTFGIQIENKKTASDGWILWIRHRPAFYKCWTISMLNENGSRLHTHTDTCTCTCTGMDPTDCHVIVRLSPSSSQHSMLVDRHDNTVEGLFCSSSRTQLNTPKETCPWNGSHEKKRNNTVPRLARCRKLCHQLNSISMQRNIYR